MNAPATGIKKPSLTRSLFILILLFTSLAQITTDVYTPSMPALTRAFSTTDTVIQFTMSLYMLGFSASHLYYGPLSDRIGRRSPILFGIALCVLGSLVCAIAPSVELVLVGRFIQGCGVGACSAVGRPIMRDLLSGNHLARLGSHLGMINVFMIAAAPMAGGYIQHWAGWRMNFTVIFLYSSLIWILLYKLLPETNQDLQANATEWSVVLKNYQTVIKNKIFLGYTLCSSFAYAGIISYVTISPFLLQNVIGLTPVQFGWLALLSAASFFISTFLNSRYVIAKGISTMVILGNTMMSIGGASMLALSLCGFLNTVVVVLPISLFCMGAGFTFSNSFAGAFHPFPKMSGSAGALYGCIQILGGALISGVISLLPQHNQTPLAIVLTGLGLLSLITMRQWILRSTEESQQDSLVYP